VRPISKTARPKWTGGVAQADSVSFANTKPSSKPSFERERESEREREKQETERDIWGGEERKSILRSKKVVDLTMSLPLPPSKKLQESGTLTEE
jgi:hypothetical protein